MKNFLMILFGLFVIAFIVFFIMWIYSLIKSKNKEYGEMPKTYWIGLIGFQSSVLCVNILNAIMKSIS